MLEISTDGTQKFEVDADLQSLHSFSLLSFFEWKKIFKYEMKKKIEP